MIDIERLNIMENESVEEYQIRLSTYKLKDKEDIDWSEISELLVQAGGKKKHPDNLRKEGYACVMAYDVYSKKISELEDEYYIKLKEIQGKINSQIEDKRLEKIENKLLQLDKEKLKLKDQRNNLNSIKREISRVEHLIEVAKDEINELNKLKPMISEELDLKISDCTGICMISDVHLGVEVDNILTMYNPEICKYKMNYYINEVIKYGEFNNIDELYVLGLGDYVTGILRNINRYEARLDISEQIITVSELLTESINKLSKHFKCKVALVCGNHDEIRLGSPDNTKIQESFTNFINKFVYLRLENNSNVEFLHNKDTDNEHITFELRGFNFFASHGNRDRDKQLDRTIEMFDSNIDFILRGHYHQPKIEYKNKTCCITNGCFSGENYSKNARLYSPSVQKFLIIDNNGLRCNYDINLDKYNK